MQEHQVKLSVYGILIDKDKKILLQKRANTSYAEGWWSLPGGHVEGGESLPAAIKRELLEELGVSVELQSCNFRLTLIRKPGPTKRYVNFFYIIQNWSGTPIIADNKASKLAFYSSEQLPEPTLPYIKEALSLIEGNIPFSESDY